jgi:septum formation protein
VSQRRFILASASPRRKALLGSLGIDFEVRPSNIDESQFIDRLGRLAPGAMASALAQAKALDVAAQVSGDALVLGADTIVVLDENVLGKPDDPEHAVEMLMTLSGRTHQVYTALSLVPVAEGSAASPRTAFSVTDVEFAPFDEARARAYVTTGESLDKAGAYGIQAAGALLIPRIRGDYFNVVGLPLYLLGQMLEENGWRIL